jgi:hypothetical protein
MKTIRQTVTIKAAPLDIYQALMDSTQTGVPDDQEAAIRQGWIECYWDPLRALFATAATRSSPRRGSASSAGRSRGTRRRRRR